MTARFVVVRPHKGPAEPPPLAGYVEYRAEAARKFWAVAANGVVTMCSTMSAAQEALGAGLERSGG